jgi:hypothetical protein
MERGAALRGRHAGTSCLQPEPAVVCGSDRGGLGSVSLRVSLPPAKHCPGCLSLLPCFVAGG